MMTTKKIKLNTWGRNYVVVSANQGEVDSRFLEITLVDETGMTLADKEVILYAVKPDGNVIFNNCTIEEAPEMTVSVELTSQMSSMPGVMMCELHVTNTSQEVLKIIGFEIVILKCSDTSESIESTSEFTRLSTALSDVETLKNEYQALIDTPLSYNYLGTCPVSYGGTGNNSLTSGGILIGNGVNAITSLSELPLSKGGTGAITAGDALTNLGIPVETGTWTPVMRAATTDPTVTYTTQSGMYIRMGKFVYISFRCDFEIPSGGSGSGNARVSGLPYTSGTNQYCSLLKVSENYAISTTNCAAYVLDSSNLISIRQQTGAASANWMVHTSYPQTIGFCGWYIKADD